MKWLALHLALVGVANGFLSNGPHLSPQFEGQARVLKCDPAAGVMSPKRTPSPVVRRTGSNEAALSGAATTPEGAGGWDMHSRILWDTLDDWYSGVNRKVKCPFFRRRASDTIDNLALVAKFLLIRHKSILPPDVYCAPGCRSVGKKDKDGHVLPKTTHLSLTEVAALIRSDWEGGSGPHKGYYITGRLNTLIYRDDCLFDGPDPDMPVRGLRKYLSAASHLFDQRQSFAELLHLEYSPNDQTVTARWRLGGVLMLPWRPVVKPWTGSTTYLLDDDGLIYRHAEQWDISVLEAFVCTVWPELGAKLWK